MLLAQTSDKEAQADEKGTPVPRSALAREELDVDLYLAEKMLGVSLRLRSPTGAGQGVPIAGPAATGALPDVTRLRFLLAIVGPVWGSLEPMPGVSKGFGRLLPVCLGQTKHHR